MHLQARILTLVVVLGLSTGAAGLGMTAGDVDDHRNWDFYLEFLARQATADPSLPELELGDRVTILVQDPSGVPMGHTRVTVSGPVGAVERTTGADGLLHVYPGHDGLGRGAALTVRFVGQDPLAAAQVSLAAGGPGGPERPVVVTLDGAARSARALDLMFVIDTTGSMSDELRYLGAELEHIVADVTAAHPQVDLRYGLTLYRDHGDAYVVREMGFTSELAAMQSWIAAQSAAGGGDHPEAMEDGLAAALAAGWRTDAARMLVLAADAPPHVSGYHAFMDAVEDAHAQGIRIYPLAASGVAGEAEYLMRAAAALTQGRYMFLTDDSGIGDAHAEPTVPCYVVTELRDLLARVVGSELSGARIEPEEEQVIRRVGDYHMGYCVRAPVVPGQEQQEKPPVEPPIDVLPPPDPPPEPRTVEELEIIVDPEPLVKVYPSPPAKKSMPAPTEPEEVKAVTEGTEGTELVPGSIDPSLVAEEPTPPPGEEIEVLPTPPVPPADTREPGTEVPPVVPADRGAAPADPAATVGGETGGTLHSEAGKVGGASHMDGAAADRPRYAADGVDGAPVDPSTLTVSYDDHRGRTATSRPTATPAPTATMAYSHGSVDAMPVDADASGGGAGGRYLAMSEGDSGVAAPHYGSAMRTEGHSGAGPSGGTVPAFYLPAHDDVAHDTDARAGGLGSLGIVVSLLGAALVTVALLRRH